MDYKMSTGDDESMVRNDLEARRDSRGFSVVTTLAGHAALSQAMAYPTLRAQARYDR
jgi:hypothetical protein